MKLTADSFDGTCKRPVKTWLHLTLAVTVKTKPEVNPDVNPDKQMIQSIERKKLINSHRFLRRSNTIQGHIQNTLNI